MRDSSSEIGIQPQYLCRITAMLGSRETTLRGYQTENEMNDGRYYPRDEFIHL